jgi:hypothetical protein
MRGPSFGRDRPRQSSLHRAVERLHQAHAEQVAAVEEIVTITEAMTYGWVGTSEILNRLPFARTKLQTFIDQGDLQENVHFVIKGGARYWNVLRIQEWMTQSDGSRQAVNSSAILMSGEEAPAIEPIHGARNER